MNCWICKHCNKKTYSSSDFPDSQRITCVNCGRPIINYYFAPTDDIYTK
ncbi:MAG: hypothetical protein KAQ68_02270 [Clostridiales bacterium]|nr:hypothetical protein [Clostridiales bacterium]